MQDGRELGWYFSLIRRWLWLIVVCALLGATSAFVISSQMPPVYIASASLLVRQGSSDRMSEYTAILSSELLASTYSQMLGGWPVLEAAIERLGLKETPDALAKRVEVKLIPDTQLIHLSVKHTDPTWAALIANTIAKVFIAQNQVLQEERYANLLTSMQEQIVELSALMEETQARIDTLGTRTAQEEAELARLETILAGHRSTHATLQQDYEQMRLTVAQATDNVVVIERAQAPESPVEPRHSVSTTLLVHIASATGMSDSDTIQASERLARTYSQMLSGRPVLEAAIAGLELEETPEELAGRLKVTLVPDTQLIRLGVEHADPTQAVLIANTIAEAFIAQIQALQAERYTDSLANMQEQIVELSALMEETQAEIDALGTRTAQEEAELARLETILAGHRSTHATLQQDYEQMRLTVAQATDNVVVIERAQAPESPVEPRHSVSTTLLVHIASATGMSDSDTIQASERLARTYSQMLSGRPVLEAAIAGLELEETPEELAGRLKVTLVPDTQLIRLGVEHADPTQAVLIANTIAEAFIAQIQALQAERYTDSLANMQEQIVELSALIEETQAEIDALHTRTIQGQTELARLETILAGYRNTYPTLQQDYEQLRLAAGQAADNVFLVEAAQVPEKPIQRRTLYTALAATVGAMLALGAAFLLEYLDDTIKTPDDVSQALGLGTLGTIGRLAKREEELVVAARPLSPVAEAFRALCTNVRFSSIPGPLRTLLVTSPGTTEGKSITVANLAVAMAQAGLSVVAVDADLRSPRLGQLFGLDLRELVTGGRLWWGLSGSLLEGRTGSRLHPAQVQGLRVLPSGELPPNPAELMGSQHMQELLHELAGQADVVLIDSPPVLPVADATALAQAVDGVLLVLEAGKTRREAARNAVESLRQVGANVVGVVLNGVPTHKGSYYYSYYETYGDESGRRKHRPRRRKGPLAAVQRLFRRKRKVD